ncbi:hypothetical protein PASE110613_09210 [Paenibacillus sediminis]|uniref:Large polyvalent protein associated domain-containing protein n=1 Tax=Paenibacillus sediminis TaxID=664909 RepID=A0ABS4H6L0_9BACL|nr:hypothetical protein [Paenibacillus sediminis]MBP1938174.1 hypothetical protein [Paenibacillus sediminis]
MKTYREITAELTHELEQTLRINFKSSDAPITFEYGGRSYNIRDRETRMLLVAAIQDAYYRAHGEFNQRTLDAWVERGCRGERPSPATVDAALMDRLTDVVLYEEIADESADKITNAEYSFMSERQLDRRRDKETSDTAAESRGADGRDYRTPTKRRRTPYENWRVDADAKIRNKARAAQYKRDTSPGKVTEGASESFVQCRGIAQRWANDMSAVNDVIVESAREAA